MGTVAVVHGWVLWEWLIACWMGTVAVVDCLLDEYCGSGLLDMADGYCSTSTLLFVGLVLLLQGEV